MSVRHSILNFSGFFSITSLHDTAQGMKHTLESSKETAGSGSQSQLVGVQPVEGGEKAAGAEQHRAHGKHGPPLVDPVQVASRHVGHADGSRRTVQKLVSVPVGGKKQIKR